MDEYQTAKIGVAEKVATALVRLLEALTEAVGVMVAENKH